MTYGSYMYIDLAQLQKKSFDLHKIEDKTFKRTVYTKTATCCETE